MKTTRHYTCGHVLDVTIDGRSAIDLQDYAEAKANGKIARSRDCPDCDRRNVTRKIMELSLPDARAILLQMAGYNELRRLVELQSNKVTALDRAINS